MTTNFSVTVSAANDYYAGALNKDGQALKSALHDIISKQKVLSYNEVWNAIKYTDEDPNNTSNVILFYSGKSSSKTNSGGNVGNWNREHTWAKNPMVISELVMDLEQIFIIYAQRMCRLIALGVI